MSKHIKRNYKIGGQRSLFGIEPTRNRKNEKYIPVPGATLSAWLECVMIGDKKRIALTQNLSQSELTSAFRGHATAQTIEKINRYFSISRKDFKIQSCIITLTCSQNIL